MVPAVRIGAVVLLLLLFSGGVLAAVDDGYTVALFHFDNSSFTDESGKVTYPQSGVSYTTDQKKFGTGSMYGTGTDSWLYMLSDGDFNFLGDSMTIDCWVRFTSLPTDGTTKTPIFSVAGSPTKFNEFTIIGNRTFRLWSHYADSTENYYFNGSVATPITLNTWHHIAAVKNVSDTVIYLDGVAVGAAQTDADLMVGSGVGTFNIGLSTSHGDTAYFNGYMDELRVSNGVARWLSDFTPPTEDYRLREWEYISGSYVWTCPEYVTSVYVSIIGSGSSGHGGWLSTDVEYAGYGGHAGELLNVSGVPVTPGESYTIIAGAPGAQDAAGDVGNVPAQAGSSSWAFGYTAVGGAAVYGFLGQTGGNGDAGYMSATECASPGESVTGVSGGTGGCGYSSGGGGGAANSTGDEMGYGGAGANGAVFIIQQEYSIGNFPEFSASETNITAGEVVHFTDESIINDNLNLSYLWDFGDGYTSTTEGDVTHVYGWNGAFTVNLTLTSDTGSPTETKAEYIIVSTDNEGTGFTVSPRYVDIYAKTWLGTPIEEATVVVTPISTSSGSWDWLIAMLGIPVGDFNANTTVMTQTTDIQGRTSFFVLPTAKYDINITKAGYTFQDGSLVPSDTQYTFKADILGTELFTHGYNELEVITFFTNGSETNTTHGRIFTVYNDSLAQTTSVDIFINQSTSIGNLTTETTVANYTHGAGNFSYTFVLEGTRDHSYLVRMRSNGTVFGLVYRDYGIAFPPGPISLGIPEDLLVYVGMLGLIFIALCFTRSLPGPAAFITMFFAWIFYFMRWWRDLAPEWMVIGALIFFTVVAVFFNIMIRSKKTYGGG